MRSGDNPGNHRASQNLGLNGHWLLNDDSEGLRIGNSGLLASTGTNIIGTDGIDRRPGRG